MSIKINLAHHISIKKTSVITHVAKKLFATTPITYFCYLRRYKDGAFTFLPTIVDFGSYLFEEGNYPDSWFAGLPFDSLQSGYTFWGLAKQLSTPDTQSISQNVSTLFKLGAGVEIFEKNNDYCDFYSFSSRDASIYLVPIQLLYQFIYYFKQECHRLLLNAYEDILLLPKIETTLPPIPILNINTQQQNNTLFEIKRYYLDEHHYLTQREIEILKQLDKGGTVKCLANVLCISPRTLEHHVTSIKNKFNVSRTTEMLHVAKHYKLLC